MAILALTLIWYTFFNWSFYIPFPLNWILALPLSTICVYLIVHHFEKEYVIYKIHIEDSKSIGGILLESAVVIMSAVALLFSIYCIGEAISGFPGRILTTTRGWQTVPIDKSQTGGFYLMGFVALVFFIILTGIFSNWKSFIRREPNRKCHFWTRVKKDFSWR